MQQSFGQRLNCSTQVSSRKTAAPSRLNIARAANVDQLKEAQSILKAKLGKVPSHPIFIRLAWHDSGTYDKRIPVEKWPACGGANGSIRFEPEINHGANAGLTLALKMLKDVKVKCPEVSWADLLQLASATAVEDAGGPVVPMRYGRLEVDGPEGCHPEGNLPDGNAPFGDGSNSPFDHLRKVFYRMGFNDQEIVALSGAHTLGRAFSNRSGANTKESTPYTENGPGTKGGQSWTREWLKFDNQYFKDVKAKNDENLLVLQTDDTLFQDEGFKQYAEKYAESQEAFFEDYAKAHAKLSELGVKWDEDTPVTI